MVYICHHNFTKHSFIIIKIFIYFISYFFNKLNLKNPNFIIILNYFYFVGNIENQSQLVLNMGFVE